MGKARWSRAGATRSRPSPDGGLHLPYDSADEHRYPFRPMSQTFDFGSLAASESRDCRARIPSKQSIAQESEPATPTGIWKLGCPFRSGSVAIGPRLDCCNNHRAIGSPRVVGRKAYCDGRNLPFRGRVRSSGHITRTARSKKRTRVELFFQDFLGPGPNPATPSTLGWVKPTTDSARMLTCTHPRICSHALLPISAYGPNAYRAADCANQFRIRCIFPA